MAELGGPIDDGGNGFVDQGVFMQLQPSNRSPCGGKTKEVVGPIGRSPTVLSVPAGSQCGETNPQKARGRLAKVYSIARSIPYENFNGAMLGTSLRVTKFIGEEPHSAICSIEDI